MMKGDRYGYDGQYDMDMKKVSFEGDMTRDHSMDRLQSNQMQ